MATETSTSLTFAGALALVGALALPLFGCGEDPASQVDDASWDALSDAQRRDHLESKMEQSLRGLEEAMQDADAAAWKASRDAAINALSGLRPLLITHDRQRYAELEAEVERLTDTPPFFVRGE